MAQCFIYYRSIDEVEGGLSSAQPKGHSRAAPLNAVATCYAALLYGAHDHSSSRASSFPSSAS